MGYGVNHLLLVWPGALVREGESIGVGAFGIQKGIRRFDFLDQMVDAGLEGSGDRLAVEFGIDHLRRAADQIDQNQLRREGETVQIRLRGKEKRIEQQLVEMPLEFLRPVE